MKQYVFCILLLILFSCAPKEEDIIALSGTYTVTHDTTGNSNNIPALCWPKSVVDSGNTSTVAPSDQLNIKSGQIIQLQISGRAFQLSILGDNPTNGQPCTATGTYGIVNRTSSDVGEMTFITTSTTCSGKTFTVIANSENEVGISAVPSSIFSAENFFNISVSNGKLFVKLPFDMNFSSGLYSSTCNSTSSNSLCECIFIMNKS